MPDFDPASYRLGSTMPFFRNNNTVPLLLFRLRPVQVPSDHKRDRFRYHSSGPAARLVVQNWSPSVTSSSFNVWWQP